MTIYAAPTSWSPWAPPERPAAPRIVLLSPMLGNVLDSLCEGKSNRQIGVDWGISEDTVKTHLRRLYARCGARTRAHLLALLLTREVELLVGEARRAS